jgi:hypothetical protein
MSPDGRIAERHAHCAHRYARRCPPGRRGFGRAGCAAGLISLAKVSIREPSPHSGRGGVTSEAANDIDVTDQTPPRLSYVHEWSGSTR